MSSTKYSPISDRLYAFGQVADCQCTSFIVITVLFGRWQMFYKSSPNVNKINGIEIGMLKSGSEGGLEGGFSKNWLSSNPLSKNRFLHGQTDRVQSTLAIK